MAGHFLDELLLVSQADAVKRNVENAGTAKPIDLSLALLSQDEAAAHGESVASAFTTIWDKPPLWALPCRFVLLARVREAGTLEQA